MPKSLGVATSPLPKCYIQTRLTRTRGGQRILRVGDRPRQLQPSAALLEGRAVGSPSSSQECRGTALPGRPGLPRDKDVRVERLRRRRRGPSPAAEHRDASRSSSSMAPPSLIRLVMLRLIEKLTASGRSRQSAGLLVPKSASRSDSHSASGKHFDRPRLGRFAPPACLELTEKGRVPFERRRPCSGRTRQHRSCDQRMHRLGSWNSGCRHIRGDSFAALAVNCSLGRAANDSRARIPGRRSCVRRRDGDSRARSPPRVAANSTCRPEPVRRACGSPHRTRGRGAAFRYRENRAFKSPASSSRRSPGSRPALSRGCQFPSRSRRYCEVCPDRPAVAVGRLGRAGEDAVKRVVVFGRDRVVLVVVAAGAGDRQPQKTAGDDVDPVVDDVILIEQEPPADASRNPSPPAVCRIVAAGKLVGGDLLDDELVVTAGRR